MLQISTAALFRLGQANPLQAVDRIDEETREALGQLVTDVGAIMDHDRSAGDVEDLTERHALLDRIMKFETDHPRVTRFLSQITDVLVLLGI